MVWTINLVVHEDAVREHAQEGNLEAISALEVIDKLLGMPDTYEVMHSPFILPSELPMPAPEIKIIVRGGFKRQCCIKTLYSLRKAGYNSELGKTGVFDNGFRMPPAYEPSDLRQFVPEYCKM